ncbi:MAG: hypothetical protein IKE23_07640, partial [Exiguobacterium sp.]|nr:hypothetical protein [Exiguobacterium sp.]
MANKKTGYMPIYRSIQEHWLWTSDEQFDIRSAWIDLILSANHEDRKLNVGRDVITIHAGQMWTSIVKLANRWHWSRERVYRYIKMLKNDGMIFTDGTPNGTLLTIVNYERFAYHGNTDETTSETPNETKGETSDDTSSETQTIINNHSNHFNHSNKVPAPPR